MMSSVQCATRNIDTATLVPRHNLATPGISLTMLSAELAALEAHRYTDARRYRNHSAHTDVRTTQARGLQRAACHTEAHERSTRRHDLARAATFASGR